MAPDDGCCNSHYERVSVLYVSQFMSNDALKFFSAEQAQNPFRHRNGCMVGIAPCRESVRRFGWDDVNSRFRDACPFGEPINNIVQFGRFPFANFTRPIHSQHNLVAEEVGSEVHQRCEDQSVQSSRLDRQPSCQTK